MAQQEQIQKRKRSRNFSEEDKELLFGIVKRFEKILTSKKTNSSTNAQKLRVWEQICSQFNASALQQRNIPQLKAVWKAKMGEIRKNLASDRIQRVTTGGGAFVPRQSDQSCFLSFVQRSVQPLHNIDSSDIIFPMEDVQQIGDTVSPNFENEANPNIRSDTPDVLIEARSGEESYVEFDALNDVPVDEESGRRRETNAGEPSHSRTIQLNSPAATHETLPGTANQQNPVSGNPVRERERAIQSERGRKQNSIENAKLDVFVELKKTTIAMRNANEEEYKVNIEAAKIKAEAYSQKRDYYKLKMELMQSHSAGPS